MLKTVVLLHIFFSDFFFLKILFGVWWFFIFHFENFHFLNDLFEEHQYGLSIVIKMLINPIRMDLKITYEHQVTICLPNNINPQHKAVLYVYNLLKPPMIHITVTYVVQ